MADDLNDLLGLISDVRQGISAMRESQETRMTQLERRLERQANGRSAEGYTPGDVGLDGRSRSRRTGVELGPRDSMAEWMADRSGAEPPDEEFSLGRLVQAMITGERGSLNKLERQALTEGADSAGGVLVVDQQAATVLDLVRPAARVLEAGATVIPMGSDTYKWPRVVTGATPEWKPELAPMGESDLTFDAMTLNARTLRTRVKLSAELVEDMSPEGSGAIERELTNAFAAALDRAALLGTGTGAEPLGLANIPATLGDPAVGTPTNFAFLAAAVAAIRGANHEPTAAILSSTVAGTLDVLQALDDQPLRPPPSVEQLKVLVSNHAGDTGFVGEWPLFIVGVRPSVGVKIQQTDSSLAEDFSYILVASLRADVGVVDPTAFYVAGGITST